MRLFELIAVLALVALANGASLTREHENLNANLRTSPNFDWTDYHSLAEIEAWLDDILAVYPDVTEGFVIGKSYEGRDIRGIKISYKSGNPGIFIESNIHAREWITSATATWLINELLSSTDAQVRGVAENLDWYIVPVFNVDGFLYTHRMDKLSHWDKNRLWRQTLRPSNISGCFGVDLNRNYDSHWMENRYASPDPCDPQEYAGPHPFSEPETKAMSDFVTSIKDKLNIYLSFHAYALEIIKPSDHKNKIVENFDDLQDVCKAFSDAARTRYNTVYKYIKEEMHVTYRAPGTSIDWAYYKQGIKISLAFEFRGPKGDPFGFELPPQNIIPNSEETLDGIMALVSRSNELGYLELKYES